MTYPSDESLSPNAYVGADIVASNGDRTIRGPNLRFDILDGAWARTDIPVQEAELGAPMLSWGYE
ncbi:MAG: hypothetical protein WAN87_01145 [Thermoplasmata archaeon]